MPLPCPTEQSRHVSGSGCRTTTEAGRGIASLVLTSEEDGECWGLGAAISVIIRRRARLCKAMGLVWGAGRPCAVLWPGSTAGLRCGETRLGPEPEGLAVSPVPGLCGGVGHLVLGEEAADGVWCCATAGSPSGSPSCLLRPWPGQRSSQG